MGTLDRLAYEVAAKDALWPVLPVVMADLTSGEILYVSKFAADIFNYDPEELQGQLIETLVPESLRGNHAHWRGDANVPRSRLLGVGRQLQGQKKDGSLFPVHVGLTIMELHDRQVGIAVVVDLTGIVSQITTQAEVANHD